MFLCVRFGRSMPLISLVCRMHSKMGSSVSIYRIGDKGQPCLTDMLILKGWVMLNFIKYPVEGFSWSLLSMHASVFFYVGVLNNVSN